MLGVMARGESDKSAVRIRRKHVELAAAGEVSGGGTRPYGYTRDRLHPVAEEAAVIREATRRVLAGESLRSVCFGFQRAGDHHLDRGIVVDPDHAPDAVVGAYLGTP